MIVPSLIQTNPSLKNKLMFFNVSLKIKPEQTDYQIKSSFDQLNILMTIYNWCIQIYRN